MTRYTRHEVTHAFHILLRNQGARNLVDRGCTGKLEIVNMHHFAILGW